MSLPFPPADSFFLEIVLTGCLFPESQGTAGDGTKIFGGCGRCHSSAPKKHPQGCCMSTVLSQGKAMSSAVGTGLVPHTGGSARSGFRQRWGPASLT